MNTREVATIQPWQWLLVGVPACFLLIFFVLPNCVLLSASFTRSEAQEMTGEFTFENYALFFGEAIYLQALARTFLIGAAVGLFVCILGFPVAYFLTRTESRWKGPLTALCLAPLLASVIVKTYGWQVILNPFGTINELLLAWHIVQNRVTFMPSNGAIIIGLTHALLPYGILTMLASLQGLQPSLERAAMSLGANRTRTFFRIVLPLCRPGLIGGFVLAFSLSISAYATPKMLGGPQHETIATLIYTIMMSILDWSLGSAFGVVLIATSLTLAYLAARAGARRMGS